MGAQWHGLVEDPEIGEGQLGNEGVAADIFREERRQPIDAAEIHHAAASQVGSTHVELVVLDAVALDVAVDFS